jgi:hypothetical protein
MASSSLRPWRLLTVVLAACLVSPSAALTMPSSAAANDCNGVSFASSDAFTMNEDSQAVLPVFANDLCTDGVTGVTITVVSGPSHGAFKYWSFPNGVYYYPNQDYNGTDSFQYRFQSNEYPDYSTGTVTITIEPVNDAPSIFWAAASDCHYGISITVAEDSGPYSHDCYLGLSPGGGPDESSQTVGIVVTGYDASLFSVAPHFDATGLAFTPAPNANGKTSIAYFAKDNGGTANGGVDTSPTQYSASITITPVDDAPVAKADSYTLQAGTTQTAPAPGVLANDTDVDGPSLTAHLASLPSHGTLTLLSDGSFSYHPDAGFSGADSFTYTASDGTLSSTPAKVTLTVSATPTPAPTPTSHSGATPTPHSGATPTPHSGATPTPTPVPTPTPPAASDGVSASNDGQGTLGPGGSGSGGSVAPSDSASAASTDVFPAAAPTPDLSASVSSGPGTEPPWLAIIAIVLILVVGSNLVVYQLVRRGRPGKGPGGSGTGS